MLLLFFGVMLILIFGGNRRRQLSGTSAQPFLVPLFLYRDWIDCFVCPLEWDIYYFDYDCD